MLALQTAGVKVVRYLLREIQRYQNTIPYDPVDDTASTCVRENT